VWWNYFADLQAGDAAGESAVRRGGTCLFVLVDVHFSCLIFYYRFCV